jgi:hypothetical protein
MPKLNKPIKRETAASIFERSQHRNIIVSVEPTRDGAMIGFRLKGSRDTYRLPVAGLYQRAVEHHLAKIEKKAKHIVKVDKRTLKGARAQARKELKEDLR